MTATGLYVPNVTLGSFDFQGLEIRDLCGTISLDRTDPF